MPVKTIGRISASIPLGNSSSVSLDLLYDMGSKKCSLKKTNLDPHGGQDGPGTGYYSQQEIVASNLTAPKDIINAIKREISGDLILSHYAKINSFEWVEAHGKLKGLSIPAVTNALLIGDLGYAQWVDLSPSAKQVRSERDVMKDIVSRGAVEIEHQFKSKPELLRRYEDNAYHLAENFIFADPVAKTLNRGSWDKVMDELVTEAILIGEDLKAEMKV